MFVSVEDDEISGAFLEGLAMNVPVWTQSAVRLRLLQSMEKMDDSTAREEAELFVFALGKLPN